MLLPADKSEAIRVLLTENPQCTPTNANLLFSVFPVHTWPVIREELNASVLQDLNRLPALFVSEWDDSETTVTCPCTVDLSTRKIDNIEMQNRSFTSEDPKITLDNLDDAISQLDREYILLFNIEFPAVSTQDRDRKQSMVFHYD